LAGETAWRLYHPVILAVAFDPHGRYTIAYPARRVNRSSNQRACWFGFRGAKSFCIVTSINVRTCYYGKTGEARAEVCVRYRWWTNGLERSSDWNTGLPSSRWLNVVRLFVQSNLPGKYVIFWLWTYVF